MKLSKIALAAAALMISISPVAMAKHLNNYQEILAEMKTGKIVYALVDYSKCQTKEKGNDEYGMELRTIGIRMDHLFELSETRFDGKRMNVIGYAYNNWGGGRAGYQLSRQLIHVWEDGSIDLLEDSVDPTTFKLKDREWMICKVGKEGGVTFTS